MRAGDTLHPYDNHTITLPTGHCKESHKGIVCVSVVYVCMYLYVCACVHLCVCAHVRAGPCVYVSVCVCTRACRSVCVCVHMCMRVHVCVCVRLCVCTCVRVGVRKKVLLGRGFMGESDVPHPRLCLEAPPQRVQYF